MRRFEVNDRHSHDGVSLSYTQYYVELYINIQKIIGVMFSLFDFFN